jgi:hypothetical protein
LNLYPSPTHFTLKMKAAWASETFYLTSSLHGVITQETATWISIQARITSPWKWRQDGPPKRWYPTTML